MKDAHAGSNRLKLSYSLSHNKIFRVRILLINNSTTMRLRRIDYRDSFAFIFIFRKLPMHIYNIGLRAI